MVSHIILFLLSFVAIWFAARLVVATVANLSRFLLLSAFSLSFLVFGITSSLPEFFVSLSAVMAGNYEIFAGTLLGASVAIFLLVFPLLAIFSRGIELSPQLKRGRLVFSLFVTFLPFIFVLDRVLTQAEGALMIASYVAILILIEKDKHLFGKFERGFIKKPQVEIAGLIKIVFGAIILFFAGRQLVSQTVYLSTALSINMLVLSLVLLSVGTDLPELTVAVVSALKKQKTIAMGDYIGSAAVNTLIFGFFGLFFGPIKLDFAGFNETFFFFLPGLVLFYIFCRTKHRLSPREGAVLILLYFTFIVSQILAK